MESLEKFIEKRMQQSEFSAMMIPRYLEKPNAFLGSKNYTLEQGKEFEVDAEKCKAVLNFLKLYNKRGSDKIMFHSISGNTGTFIKEFENRFGTAILIKLANGREYFAPKAEFKEIA